MLSAVKKKVFFATLGSSRTPRAENPPKGAERSAVVAQKSRSGKNSHEGFPPHYSRPLNPRARAPLGRGGGARLPSERLGAGKPHPPKKRMSGREHSVPTQNSHFHHAREVSMLHLVPTRPDFSWHAQLRRIRSTSHTGKQ